MAEVKLSKEEIEALISEIDSSLVTVMATKITASAFTEKMNLTSFTQMEDFVLNDANSINGLVQNFGTILNGAMTTISCSVSEFADFESNIAESILKSELDKTRQNIKGSY